MSNALTPIVTKFVPAWLLRIFTILTDVLVQGRIITGGAYSKEAGPTIPQGLIGIPGPIKKTLVKKGVQVALKKIDTTEEREAISHGLPGWLATCAAAVLTLVYTFLEGADLNVLVNNPVLFGKMLLTFVVTRLLMQWQTPDTHIIKEPVTPDDNNDKE